MQSTKTDMPVRATISSAGYDLFIPKDLDVKAGVQYMVGTGVYLEDADTVSFGGTVMPYVFILAPRSGLGIKEGFRLLNTIGVIDQDYRNEIVVAFEMTHDHTFKAGDKIAQGIFLPAGVLMGETAPVSERKGGLGSTGN